MNIYFIVFDTNVRNTKLGINNRKLGTNLRVLDPRKEVNIGPSGWKSDDKRGSENGVVCWNVYRFSYPRSFPHRGPILHEQSLYSSAPKGRVDPFEFSRFINNVIRHSTTGPFDEDSWLVSGIYSRPSRPYNTRKTNNVGFLGVCVRSSLKTRDNSLSRILRRRYVPEIG